MAVSVVSLTDQFARAEERERWDRAEVLMFQQQMLDACRAYAYAHSPFYQRFHAGLMDSPLHALPVLTRALMLEQFDALVTDREIRLADVRAYLAAPTGRYLDSYQVMATSGSTGQPGIFLYDQQESAVRARTFLRASGWGGVTPLSRSAAITSRSPLLLNGQRAMGLHLSALEPLETQVAQLNEWQPDSIVGYASAMAALANEQQHGRLHIAPQSVFCAADTLTSDHRRRIEAAWNTRLFNTYGATEGGILAAECSAHQGLHLFEDFTILEVVDADNQPVPPGEQGDKVLLTVLFRRTQPLIRYEITDLVRAAAPEPCPCGRPFARISGVQGRVIEVLALANSAGGMVDISPYVFENIFDTQPVGRWQVVHEHDGLHVHLIDASTLDAPALTALLQQELRACGAVPPPITIHHVQALYQHASGKTPMVVSHVPRPTA